MVNEMNHIMIDGEKLYGHELMAVGYFPFEIDMHLMVAQRLFEKGEVKGKAEALKWLEDAVQTGRVAGIKFGQEHIGIEEKRDGLVEKIQRLFN